MIVPTCFKESIPRAGSMPSAQRILLCAISAAGIIGLNPSDVAAKPGWGNCTECHGPALSTTPADGATLDFGSVLVGDSVDKLLTITNTGGSRGGRSIRLSGDFPASSGAYSLAGQTHFSNLSRNASVDRTYTYGPATRGTDSRDMTATADESPDGWPVVQGSSTVTFTGSGVAPVADVDSAEANTGNVRIGDSASPRFVVRNLGDGNLSGRGADSNLQGSVPGGSGAFVGAGGSVELMDGASTEFQYSFTPADRGLQSTPIEISFANGSPDGANQAHTVNVQLQGVGVGPDFGSSPEPDSVIDFGEIASDETSTQSLLLSNSATDGDLGNLTNLTLLSAIVSGPDADWFSIDSFVPGTILSTTESVTVDLLFNPQGQTGPLQATLTLTTDQRTAFGAPGDVFSYAMAGSVLSSGPLGDYNENGKLDVGDIDLQAVEMQKDPAAQDLAKFDHNNDGVINLGDTGHPGDRLIWIKDLFGTSVGDANLNGVFNSDDLVGVFKAANYRTGEKATWAEGDWTGDMVFKSDDLLLAFQDDGYVVPGRALAAVPEPASLSLLLVGLIAIASHRRQFGLRGAVG